MKKEGKKGYMKPKEIQAEIDKLEGKAPFFALKELSESLEGKSITKEKFDQIVEAIIERVEQSRIDKKIEGMAGQVTRLSEGFERVEKLVSERPPLEIPKERIVQLDEKVTTISKSLEENISSSKEKKEGLNQRLKIIEDRSSGAKESIKGLEKLEKEIKSVSNGFYGLSKDMSVMLGGLDINKIITGILGEVGE
jgi:DNA repair exonuclease SbcCD ATPase subunit